MKTYADEGYEAFRKGVGRNPYDEDEPGHDDWEQGQRDALADFEDRALAHDEFWARMKKEEPKL